MTGLILPWQHFHLSSQLARLPIYTLLLCSSVVQAAGTGDPAPGKCSSSDIQYQITNIVPYGICSTISDTINIDFDVLIWGNPQRYNLAVGYTNSGDNILQDVSCLATGIDLDAVGCDDYDGSGTEATPLTTSSSFTVNCDLDGNSLVDPLLGVDFYVNIDANAGGTTAGINSPKCLFQAGNSFPLSPAELTLKKVVVNDDGGTASISDWTLTAELGSGTTMLTGSSGVTSDALPAGKYVLSESGPSGYILESLSCKGAVFDAATLTLDLSPGDSAICEFSNNDTNPAIEPKRVDIQIQKSVSDNSPNVGSIIEFQLLVSNHGPDTATNIVVTDVVAAGFEYNAGSASGGFSTRDADPAGSGLQWNIPSLAAGNTTLLTFEVQVLPP